MDRATAPAAVSAGARGRRRADPHASGGNHDGRRRAVDHPAHAGARQRQQGRGGAAAGPRREDHSEQAARLRTDRMRVATRLRLTFGLLLLVFGVIGAVLVVAMRSSAEGTHTLAAIAAREQGAWMQGRRLDDMAASLRKYGVGGDPEYLERVATLTRVHEGHIRALELQSM